MRLDKFVAKALASTRSKAKKLILSGQVTIDSIEQKAIVQKSTGFILSGKENIKLAGKALTISAQRYILLNKPKGYICSTKDEQHPSALNLLNWSDISNLHFAGRLDVDTSGLVLISDDGKWTHRITSPKYKQAKVYIVSLAGKLSDASLEKLSKGVLLKDSDKPTLTAAVSIVNERQIQLIITEGRYHQVKRMIAAVGNHVTDLHRESIGNITIGNKLQLGQWRYLTEKEIQGF